MNINSLIKKDKNILKGYVDQGRTTYEHIIPQLMFLKYFARCDRLNRRLVKNPKVEVKINGDWHCDTLLYWQTKIGKEKDNFEEIVEIQTQYYWCMPFSNTEDGGEIVDLLEKEGHISKVKAEDYRKRYLKRLESYENENPGLGYLGHINFVCEEDMHGEFIGSFEVNSESELERKINRVLKKPNSASYEEGYEGPPEISYISFAVPESGKEWFLKDIIINELPVAALYYYDDREINRFHEEHHRLKQKRYKNKRRNKKINRKIDALFEKTLEYHLDNVHSFVSKPDVFNKQLLKLKNNEIPCL